MLQKHKHRKQESKPSIQDSLLKLLLFIIVQLFYQQQVIGANVIISHLLGLVNPFYHKILKVFDIFQLTPDTRVISSQNAQHFHENQKNEPRLFYKTVQV